MVKDGIIEDATGNAVIHIWDELIDKLQNSKSYSLKNMSVENYSGNTKLGTTAFTTFDEVQPVLKEVKGQTFCKIQIRKLLPKNFNLLANLTFTCNIKLNCATKRFRTTSLPMLSSAHHVVLLPRRQHHLRKLLATLCLCWQHWNMVHCIQMCCNFLLTRIKNVT